MNLEVGTPLWSNGFGVVSWIGEAHVGVVFLYDGSPKIVGHAARAAAESWAKHWADLRAEGLVVAVPTRGILEESKGEDLK
jgi:hypothetical protein